MVLPRRRSILAIVALLCFAGSFGATTGAGCLDPGRPNDLRAALRGEVTKRIPDLDADEIEAQTEDALAAAKGSDPPGLGLPAVGLLAGLLLWTAILMVAGLVVRTHQWGRISALLSLIVSIILLFTSLFGLFEAIAMLLLMVGLFLAAPFGTLAYIAVYGFFPTGAAAGLLSASLMLTLGGGLALGLGQPRIVTAKMFMTLFITVLLAAVILALLHGWVPGILVSIADAIGAIIALVLTLVWSVVLLITSIISLVKGLVRN